MIRSQSVEAAIHRGRTQSVSELGPLLETSSASVVLTPSKHLLGGEEASSSDDRSLYATDVTSRTTPIRTPTFAVTSPEIRRKTEIKMKEASTTPKSAEALSPITQLQKMKNKVREKSVRVSSAGAGQDTMPRSSYREDRSMAEADESESWTSEGENRMELSYEEEDLPIEEERTYSRIERLREFYEGREERDDRDSWYTSRTSRSERSDRSDGTERYDRDERVEKYRTSERGERQRSRGSFIERDGEGRYERGERDRRDSDSRDRAKEREEKDRRERRSTAGPSAKNLSPYRYVEDRRASMSGERPRSISKSGPGAEETRESSRSESREKDRDRDRKRRDKNSERDRDRPRERDRGASTDKLAVSDREKSLSSKLKRTGSSYSIREERLEETKGGGSMIVSMERDTRPRDRTGSGGRSPKPSDEERQRRDDRESTRRGPSFEDRKGWNMLRDREERERREEEARRRRDPFLELLSEVDSLWASSDGSDVAEENGIKEDAVMLVNGRSEDRPISLMRPLPPLQSVSGAVSMPKSLLGKYLLIRWTMRPTRPSASSLGQPE